MRYPFNAESNEVLVYNNNKASSVKVCESHEKAREFAAELNAIINTEREILRDFVTQYETLMETNGASADLGGIPAGHWLAGRLNKTYEVAKAKLAMLDRAV